VPAVDTVPYPSLPALPLCVQGQFDPLVFVEGNAMLRAGRTDTDEVENSSINSAVATALSAVELAAPTRST